MTEHKSTDRLPDLLPENPLPLAADWMEHARTAAGQRNPNSMTLVSVGNNGQPSARIVLCKAFEVDPGFLVFYTNYESHKSRELAAHPRVACVMHWDAIGRQIRFEGQALRSPATESDAYFASRGWGSQLGAWGSDQSRPVESREALIQQVEQRAETLGIELGENTYTLAGDSAPDIARPPHWGGYRIWLSALELWVEGSDRIHDRARWERSLSSAGSGDDFVTGDWHGTRLQP